MLVKSATSQSVVVCFFLQFLLVCMYGGQFQILFDKFPNLQTNKFQYSSFMCSCKCVYLHISVWYNSFCLKIALILLTVQMYCQKISDNFCLKKILFFIFLKGIFTRCRILGSQTFFFQYLKGTISLSSAYSVLRRILMLFFLLYMLCMFLFGGCFQNFLFICNFQQFESDISWWFFSIHLLIWHLYTFIF